jgi:hypothetical protein
MFSLRDWSQKTKINFYENTRTNFLNIQDQITKLCVQGSEWTDDSVASFLGHNANINSPRLDGPSSLSDSVSDMRAKIDLLYTDIVNNLLLSANCSVPFIKANVRKPWWDASLNNLKALSIHSHSIWIEAGRPRHGDIFSEKQKAKFNYKKRILENKRNNEFNVSDTLQNMLLDNDQLSFWKIWRKKFGAKIKPASCIDGITEQVGIANKFADIFASTCKPSIAQRPTADLEKRAFIERLANYTGAAVNYKSVINIETVHNCVLKLNCGKAAGYDSLTAEFLKFSHPVVISCITKLFSLMLKFCHVPDDFGIGITVPLLKSDTKGSVASSEAYRGITIMPVISKLFEIIVLQILDPYLSSCISQFGF